MPNTVFVEFVAFWSTTFVLVLARVSIFFLVFPLFRYGSVPRLIKVSLAMALSAAWLPSFATVTSGVLPALANGGWMDLMVALAREVMIGGALGYFLGLFLLPAEIAGAYIGQEMGLSMAMISDPTSGAQKNVVGDGLGALALLIFFGSDIHHLVLGTLYASFTHSFGGGGFPDFHLAMFTQGLSNVERWGLEIAAPVGVVLFLTTLLLSVMLRTSPHLNLFSVGTMLRLGIGLVAMFIFLPDITSMIRVAFSNVLGAVRELGL